MPKLHKLIYAATALFFAYSVGYRLGDHHGFSRGVNQTVDLVLDLLKREPSEGVSNL